MLLAFHRSSMITMDERGKHTGSQGGVTGTSRGIGNRARHYMDVMSLRAWSSSSLMALYFSFCAYSSSIRQGKGGGRRGGPEGSGNCG